MLCFVFFKSIFPFLLILFGLIRVLLSDSGVCYDKLGCFDITNDFVNITYRPFNLLPESPQRINTKFLLYTRLNKKTPQYVNYTNDLNAIKSTNFNANKETKFIIHGFIDNKEFGKWLTQMKDELLIKGDYNVIITDWSEGNGSSLNFVYFEY